MLRSIALVALVSAFTLGCKGKSGGAPACGAVGAQFYTLVRADLDKVKLDPGRARAVEDQLPAMRDSLVASCTEGKWSPRSVPAWPEQRITSRSRRASNT